MATPVSSKLEQHAATLGVKGKVDLARAALKFGKKIDQATPADDAKLRELAKEIFNLTL
jgi:hypothetical protein